MLLFGGSSGVLRWIFKTLTEYTANHGVSYWDHHWSKICCSLWAEGYQWGGPLPHEADLEGGVPTSRNSTDVQAGLGPYRRHCLYPRHWNTCWYSHRLPRPSNNRLRVAPGGIIAALAYRCIWYTDTWSIPSLSLTRAQGLTHGEGSVIFLYPQRHLR